MYIPPKIKQIIVKYLNKAITIYKLVVFCIFEKENMAAIIKKIANQT